MSPRLPHSVGAPPHVLQEAFIGWLGEVGPSCEVCRLVPPLWSRLPGGLRGGGSTRRGTEDSPSQGGHWHVRGIGAGLKGSEGPLGASWV